MKMRYLVLYTTKRIIWSLHIQNQFWFKLSKQHRVFGSTAKRIDFDRIDFS